MRQVLSLPRITFVLLTNSQEIMGKSTVNYFEVNLKYFKFAKPD